MTAKPPLRPPGVRAAEEGQPAQQPHDVLLLGPMAAHWTAAKQQAKTWDLQLGGWHTVRQVAQDIPGSAELEHKMCELGRVDCHLSAVALTVAVFWICGSRKPAHFT